MPCRVTEIFKKADQLIIWKNENQAHKYYIHTLSEQKRDVNPPFSACCSDKVSHLNQTASSHF